jgi:hypothetical protein
MSNPPERIWIEDEFGEGDEDQWTYGTWDVRNYKGYDVEYVRADTVQAQIAAERERCAKVADAQEARATAREEEADDESDFANGVFFGTKVGARNIAAEIRKEDRPMSDPITAPAAQPGTAPTPDQPPTPPPARE